MNLTLEKNKMTNDYGTQIQELNLECSDLRKALNNAENSSVSYKKEKERYSNQMAKKVEEFGVIQNSSNKLLEDLDKSHEIIQKLQNENRYFQNQLKSIKTTVNTKEARLMESDKKMLEIINKYDEMAARYESIHKDLIESKENNVELVKEKENLIAKIKLNETVITWLNKQINQSKNREITSNLNHHNNEDDQTTFKFNKSDPISTPLTNLHMATTVTTKLNQQQTSSLKQLKPVFLPQRK